MKIVWKQKLKIIQNYYWAIEIDYNLKGNLDLVDKVKEFATVSQMVEFSTMVSTIDKEKNKSSFTRVKSVDANYPLYGEVIFEPKGALEKLNQDRYNFSK